MAKKTIQCSQEGCKNSFTFDDATPDDDAGARVGGWSKVDGKWVGCAKPGSSCPLVQVEPKPEK